MLAIEEEIYDDELEIPYRVVENSTGDLGAAAYRRFDLEAWMPGRGDGRSRRGDQRQQLHRLPGAPAQRPVSRRQPKSSSSAGPSIHRSVVFGSSPSMPMCVRRRTMC